MTKMTQQLWVWWTALLLCGVARAQEAPARPPANPAAVAEIVDSVDAPEPLPQSMPGAPGTRIGSGVLEALPQPPDRPASLFAPPLLLPSTPMPINAPYFTHDPLLDFSPTAPPGWFAGAEVQIVKPHLLPQMSNSVLPGHFINNIPTSNSIGGRSTIVNLPSANLDWTASPRIFAGYRLPSGFGEFMVSYRSLGTTGGGIIPSGNTPLALNSRFAFQMLDFDYNSRQLSLGPQWDMKWSVGLRSLFLFFDSQAFRPLTQSAAGGVFQASEFNNLYGLGPHAVLDLSRRLGSSGWSIEMRTDVAGTFDYVTNGWQTSSSPLGPNGRPLLGQTRVFGHQAAPMINGRLGLGWQPSPTSLTRVFAGYQYEVIWDLNRVPQSNNTPVVPPSLGQYWSQGIVLQATFRY